MNVNVLAGLDRLHHFADVAAVLDDGVARRKIAQGQLVAQRDVHERFGGQLFVGGKVAAFKGLPGLHVHHRHADGVALVVDEKVDHGCGDSEKTVDVYREPGGNPKSEYPKSETNPNGEIRKS